MAVALTITDLVNAGQFSATVAGSTAGATNTLYYQPVDQESDGLTWRLAGSRTSDGVITGTVQPGHYAWHVLSVLGPASAVSNVVRRSVTDGLAAVHDRIMDAVVARCNLIGFDGIRKVYRHKITSLLKPEFPSVVVTAFLQTETMLGGTNGHDDIGYPTYLIFLSRDPQEDESAGRTLLWRQQANRGFRNQRLPGVHEVWMCDVEPGPVFETDEGKFQHIASSLTLRHRAREVRGLGA